MRARCECARDCAQQSARQPIAATFADDRQARIAAGLGEDFSCVSLDGLGGGVDAGLTRLGGIFLEQVLGRVPDAAMMIVGDPRGVTMRNHRNAVGADDPERTVVLLGHRHGGQERVAAVVRAVDSDQNIGRWEREECSHSLTVREQRDSADGVPRLGESGEVGQRLEGVDGVGVGHPFERVALDQSFDRHLELLARPGVRDGRHGDNVIGNVSR